MKMIQPIKDNAPFWKDLIRDCEEAIIHAFMILARTTKREAEDQIRKATRKILDKKSDSG